MPLPQPDSLITYNTKGDLVCLSGPDAIAMYKAFTLVSALRLWASTKIIPTRGFGIKKMLALATTITKQSYRTNRNAALIAATDVEIWAKTMKAALPTEVRGN